MRVILLGVGLAMSVSAAQAQTTRCGWELGKWVCRAEQPRYQPDPMQGARDGFQNGWNNMQRMMQARREAEARAAADARALAEQASQASDDSLAAERRRLEAVDIVKRYIAAGMCDDAKRVALEHFGTKGFQDAEALCPG